MKFSMVAVVFSALVAASALGDEKETPKPADSGLNDARQKASYGVGLSFGKQIAAQGIDLDLESLVGGIRDALAGKGPRLTDQQIQEAMVAYQQDLIAKKTKDGEAFLEENKKKDGVKITASGLQYKVIKEGTGKSPKATDTVTVNYEGRLTDNTVFDSSSKNGGPQSFPVNGVIKGFSEALQMMKTGSKWQVYIPANLAYGANPPARGRITPNVPLVFDLELIDVKEGGK
jgi:FKBP-type peptidyl-prolyl cis-trans isomerase